MTPTETPPPDLVPQPGPDLPPPKHSLMARLRNYFLTVPRELDESAMVDGATRLQALRSVVLPVAMPGIAATGIFSFILSWNEFLYANTFISSADLRTLPVGLQSLIGEFTTDWGLLMAGAVITTMPIVVIFFFVQRRLTQGLASGAVSDG